MHAMIRDDVEIFRLLSLNLIFLLHGNQKLSFRSKGHHVKGGNCSRTKRNLHFITILRSSGYEACTIASLAAFAVLSCNNIAKHEHEHARVDRKE